MTTTEEQTVLESDLELDQAIVNSDRARLEKLCAPDFVMTHTTGRIESRESWIESQSDPAAGFSARTTTDQTIELHGDIAITMAKQELVLKRGGTVKLQYVRIFRNNPGGWQILAHKPTRLPD